MYNRGDSLLRLVRYVYSCLGRGGGEGGRGRKSCVGTGKRKKLLSRLKENIDLSPFFEEGQRGMEIPLR